MGSDVAVTVDKAAPWRAAFEAATTVGSATAPLLMAGPPGWAAWAGSVALAGGGALVLSRGRANLIGGFLPGGPPTLTSRSKAPKRPSCPR